MAPIRTALIGLSSRASTSWASGSHLPYLLSPLGREHFQIVALLNSSISAAQAAIATYSLPSTTKAYGSASDLASDPDVDLVVCCTRVDVHYDSVLPSVQAGKSVYVEWPLAQNGEKARELVELARQKGGKGVIGLQTRLTPVVRRLKELLEGGRIGKVLSAEVKAFGGTNGRDVVPRGLDYFLRREVGGNVYTIGFAHMFDWVKEVLGQHQPAVLTGHFQLQRPQNQIRDADGSLTPASSNVPDLINVTATLSPSPAITPGATLQAHLRRGKPFPGEPPLVFSIYGEKGEIRLTSTAGTALWSVADTEAVKIEVHNFETGEVEKVDWDWEGWQNDLPAAARGVGAVYEEFFKGSEGEGKGTYPTFEDALVLHEQLEGMVAPFYAKQG